MDTPQNQVPNVQVAHALAESEHLRIDPAKLQYLSDYDVMIGGFGSVRVAKLGDQMVAVKELRITGTRNDRARFSMRFARELKVWAPLDHPNLLKLSGFYTDSDMSIAQFICPFYEYGHIGNYIEIHNPDQDLRLQLGKDTALGLGYLHEHRIAHGDLKELNVLVDPQPKALLCDYGLAKMVNPEGVKSGMSTSGMPMTVRFASPELLNGSRPDLASDMWAWGCLFLKILKGVGPYDGTSDMACMIKIVQGVPPAVLSRLDISTSTRHMIEQCWDQDPFARPGIERCIKTIELIQSSTSSHIPMTILGASGRVTNSVAFSQDGLLLASASDDSMVRVWNVEATALMNTLRCQAPVYSVSFSPNGKQLAYGLLDGSIKTWDPIPERPTDPFGAFTPWSDTIRLPTGETVHSLTFSPNDSRLAAGLSEGKVQMWSKTHGELLFTLKGDGLGTWGLAFSPDGRWLAYCSMGKTVWIQDTAITTPPGTPQEWPLAVKLEGHTAMTGSVTFSPNGLWMASGGYDRTIIIRDVQSWANYAVLHSENEITSLAISPDSTQITSGTALGEIHIWDLKSTTLLTTLEGHTRRIGAVAFSPNGKWIASASDDSTARLWKMPPYVRIHVPPGLPA